MIYLYLHDYSYCDCRDCRIVCWLAIYVLLVTLVVLGRGSEPRDLDLLILRGGSYSELAAWGRREENCELTSLGRQLTKSDRVKLQKLTKFRQENDAKP